MSPAGEAEAACIPAWEPRIRDPSRRALLPGPSYRGCLRKSPPDRRHRGPLGKPARFESNRRWQEHPRSSNRERGRGREVAKRKEGTTTNFIAGGAMESPPSSRGMNPERNTNSGQDACRREGCHPAHSEQASRYMFAEISSLSASIPYKKHAPEQGCSGA